MPPQPTRGGVSARQPLGVHLTSWLPRKHKSWDVEMQASEKMQAGTLLPVTAPPLAKPSAPHSGRERQPHEPPTPSTKCQRPTQDRHAARLHFQGYLGTHRSLVPGGTTGTKQTTSSGTKFSHQKCIQYRIRHFQSCGVPRCDRIGQLRTQEVESWLPGAGGRGTGAVHRWRFLFGVKESSRIGSDGCTVL